MLGTDLGLDTIQNQFRDVTWNTIRPFAEIVVTKPECMNLPRGYKLAGGCVSFLDLRIGPNHSQRCRCDVGDASLNCKKQLLHKVQSGQGT